MFVLALLFITAIELISGKPLSAIFGGADTGTTLKNLVNPSPAPPTTPTSTTSTTSTTGASTSTTTTTAATTTTSTTAPNGSATTTTTPTTASTTTTTGPALSGSTTTTTGRRPREGLGPRYQPLNSAGRRSTKLAMPSLESSVLVTSSCPMASS